MNIWFCASKQNCLNNNELKWRDTDLIVNRIKADDLDAQSCLIQSNGNISKLNPDACKPILMLNFFYFPQSRIFHAKHAGRRKWKAMISWLIKHCRAFNVNSIKSRTLIGYGNNRVGAFFLFYVEKQIEEINSMLYRNFCWCLSKKRGKNYDNKLCHINMVPLLSCALCSVERLQ